MPSFRRAGLLYLPPLTVTLLVTALISGSVPAAAEDSRTAAAQAQVLLSKVRLLQTQTAAALERYNTALTEVASGVAANRDASAADRAAHGSAAQAQHVFDQRVRALYMSGGRAGLYASLVSSDGLAGFTSRVVVMQRLVADSRSSAVESANAAGATRLAAADANTRATSIIKTADIVGGALTRLQTLLDEQQRLLSAANTAVRRLRATEAATAALAAARVATAQATAGALRRVGPLPGSPEYFRLYHAAAATCPGLSWTVLAAIGQVESGHGRNTNNSSSGAQGPMQFMPRTFAAYGVDGDRDGRIDIRSPADSIFTAANYLCANKAGTGPAGLRNAVWRYNHADWYVDMVLALALRYAKVE